MLIFLIHGYPNGCFMYKNLVKILIDNNHTPIVMNFRTGISIDDNFQKALEIISTYPENSNKAIIAHDWGACIGWMLSKYFDKYNITHFIPISIGDCINKTNNFHHNKIYQILLSLTKFLPTFLSKHIQYNIVGKHSRELDYDSLNSNYYYNIKEAFLYFLGYKKCFVNHISDIKNTKIYHISTKIDEELNITCKKTLDDLTLYNHKVKYIDTDDHFFIKNYSYEDFLHFLTT